MKRKILTLFVAFVILQAGCGTPSAGTEATPTPYPSTEAEVGDNFGPVIYTDPSQPIETRVEDLLKRMTLAEKIGQMTQVEKNSIAPGDVTKYFIGSTAHQRQQLCRENRLRCVALPVWLWLDQWRYITSNPAGMYYKIDIA